MAPKIFRIRYLVGVGHFAQCRENRPLTDCVRNVNKSPIILYSAMAREVEKWSGIRIRDQVTTKSYQFFRLVGLITASIFNEIGWLLLQQSCTQTEWQREWMTDKSTWSRNLRLAEVIKDRKRNRKIRNKTNMTFSIGVAYDSIRRLFYLSIGS